MLPKRRFWTVELSIDKKKNSAISRPPKGVWLRYSHWANNAPNILCSPNEDLEGLTKEEIQNAFEKKGI